MDIQIFAVINLIGSSPVRLPVKGSLNSPILGVAKVKTMKQRAMTERMRMGHFGDRHWMDSAW